MLRLAQTHTDSHTQTATHTVRQPHTDSQAYEQCNWHGVSKITSSIWFNQQTGNAKLGAQREPHCVDY